MFSRDGQAQARESLVSSNEGSAVERLDGEPKSFQTSLLIPKLWDT